MIIQDKYTPTLDGVISYDLKIPDYKIPDIDNVAINGVQPQGDLEIGLYNLEVSPNIEYVTPNESKRYNDPYLSYDPSLDNEDLYAKIHPFTWGDSFNKGYKTFEIHALSSFSTAVSAIKGFAEGNPESLWDNEYTKDLAEMTKNLEETLPQYKTRNEIDNPLTSGLDSTLKSIFPAVGTVAGGITDMLVGNAVLSLLAPVTSGASAALVPANLLKNTVNISKAFTSLYKTVRGTAIGNNALRGASFINKHKKMVLSSLFYANGEAALQGAMNAQDFYDKEVQAYYNKNKIMPTGKDLSDIKDRTDKVGGATYGANIALIAGSNIIQFPGLLTGKVNQQIMKNLPVKLVNGQLVKTSSFKSFIKEVGKDAFTEGGEEFGQGVIDEITKDYYSGRDALLAESIYNGLTNKLNKEGFIEFLGGALIGGGMGGSGSLIKSFKQRNYSNHSINGFNTSTANLLDSFVKTEKLNKNIQESFDEGDPFKVGNYISSSIFELTKSAKNNHVLEARKEYFNDFKTMDNDAFNKLTQLNVTTDEQAYFVNQLIDEVKLAEHSLNQTNNIYRFNPHLESKWYKSYSRFKNNLNPIASKDLDIEIWEDFKAIQALKLYKKEVFQKEVQRLSKELNDSPLINSNFKQGILDWKEANTQPPLEVPKGFEKIAKERYGEKDRLIKSLEGKTIEEQFEAIVKFEDIAIDNLLAAKKYQTALEYIIADINNSTTESGEKQALKDIIDYKIFRSEQAAPIGEEIKVPEPSSPAHTFVVDKPSKTSKAVTPDAKAVTPDAKAVTSDAKAVTSDAKAVTPDTKAVTSDAKAVTPDTKAVTPDTTEPDIIETQKTTEPSETTEPAEPTEPAEITASQHILDTDIVTKEKKGITTIYTSPKSSVFILGNYIFGKVIETNGNYFIPNGNGIDENIRKITEDIPITKSSVTLLSWKTIIDGVKNKFKDGKPNQTKEESEKLVDILDKLDNKAVADILGVEFDKKNRDIVKSDLEQYMIENPDSNIVIIKELLKRKIIKIEC